MLLAFGAKILMGLGLSKGRANQFGAIPLLMLAGVLVWAAVAVIGNWQDKTIEAAKQAGGNEAVAAGQKTTLDQIGAANEAGNEVRRGVSRAKHDECLRSVAEGFESGCDRYKPVEPVPD